MSGGNWKDLFSAACRGDLELVRYHVEAGVDVNYCHPEFLCPPLIGAIFAQQGTVALYLLDHGAQWHITSEMDDGVNALDAARRVGLRSVEARLVALGARENLTSATAEGTAEAPWWKRAFARLRG